MKVIEFLIETTEEDRAIISLSSTLANILKKYSNIESNNKFVGTIGKLVDTPLEPFDNVRLVILDDDNFNEYSNIEYPDEPRAIEDAPGGLWDPNNRTIFINKELLDKNTLTSIISHEIRHALDDFKSNFRASASKRYASPINKKHKNINDPYMPNIEYLGQPSEINARFLEVLNSVTNLIDKYIQKYGIEKSKTYIHRMFMNALGHFEIADLFPEKEQSKDYKRLIKRGIDYIDKELEYKSKLQNNS